MYLVSGSGKKAIQKHGKCRCKYITKEDRHSLCNAYWIMGDLVRQEEFILLYVTSGVPERKRIRKGNTAPHQNSKKYYLEKNGKKYRVCKKKFWKHITLAALWF